MSSSTHLEIFKKGVNFWNEWRKQNSSVKPDLSGEILGQIDIANINLSCCNFTCVDLTGSRIVNSLIEHSNFTGAELESVDFSNSKLGWCSFGGASLDRATFTACDLRSTQFIGCGLEKTDFRESILHSTVFAFLDDLSMAMNLDKCIHLSESSIDQYTLTWSKDLSPDFLRSCGLNEEIVQRINSLFSFDTIYHSCFISYSHADIDFARKLHFDLQRAGVRCWFAPEDMKIGDRIRSTIDFSIKTAEKLLLICSCNSIASSWVEYEVETALAIERREKTVILFPIRIDDDVLRLTDGWARYIRDDRHLGDFTEWDEEDKYYNSINRLLFDLKR